MKTHLPFEIVGHSHGRKPILLYRVGNGARNCLIVGGVHGDEVEGFTLAEKFLEQFEAGVRTLPAGLGLYICPRLNPDGCAALTRANAKNVDLNRNLPTKNWSAEISNPRYSPGPQAGSEPENLALLKILEIAQPQVILSLHSYSIPMVNYDGDQSKSLAEVMAKACSLEAKGDIGYPTTGSLGNYAGIERKIPTITLEILKGQDLASVCEQHLPGLIAALHWAENNL